jgi:hypothetical protein
MSSKLRNGAVVVEEWVSRCGACKLVVEPEGEEKGQR